MNKIILNTLLLILISLSQNIAAAPQSNCDASCLAELRKAEVYINSTKYEEALQITEKYCDIDVALACFISAQLNNSLSFNRRPKPEDRALIQKQYEKACKGGYERGCFHARGHTTKILHGYDLDELVIDSGKKEVLDKERIKVLKVKNNSRVSLKHKTYINQKYPSVNLITVSDASMVMIEYGFISSIGLFDNAKLKIASGSVGKMQLDGDNLVEIVNFAEIGSIMVTNGTSDLSIYDANVKKIHLSSGVLNLNLYGADIKTVIVGPKANLNIAAKDSTLDVSGRGKYLQYTASNGSVKRIEIGGTINNIKLMK